MYYYAKQLVQEGKQHFKVKRLLSTQIYKVKKQTGRKVHNIERAFLGASRIKIFEKIRQRKESKICKQQNYK